MIQVRITEIDGEKQAAQVHSGSAGTCDDAFLTFACFTVIQSLLKTKKEVPVPALFLKSWIQEPKWYQFMNVDSFDDK